jgi:photosystem II stability/assembly factor-like uncharacterized protein
MKLLLGTAKGLIVFEKGSKNWHITKVHFTGFPVSMVYVDTRTNTWWAGLPHRHWGQKLHRSTDEGNTWQQVATPRYPNDIPLKNGKNASLKLIWCMADAGINKPHELWLGTEPGGLFHSIDNGDTWQLVESLWQERVKSDLWFGAGKDEPFIHSIVVNPLNTNHLYIAVSCAGVYETMDYGQTWQPRNTGLKATYLPNPNSEVGHDPHRLLICPNTEGVLWQQNHCGIFRSDNYGKTWDDITDKNGIANYGFALAIDDKNPNRAWVIPAQSDELRIPHDLALCVCRTDDAGQTWQPLCKGLPQKHCFDIVFRHAFDRMGSILAFGTTTGNLYISENDGDNWQLLSGNLPRIDSVLFVR